MTDSIAGRMFLAEMRGDEREWRRLAAALPRGGDDWDEFLVIAVAGLARRRFDGRDLRVVTRFAQRLVELSPHLALASPLAVEALLRGVLGEEALRDYVGDEALGQLLHAILIALVDDLEMNEAQIQKLPSQVAAHEETVYLLAGGRPGGISPAARTIRFLRRSHRRYLTDDDLRLTAPHLPSAKGPRPTALTPLSTLAGRHALATVLRHREERLRLEKILRKKAPRDPAVLGRALIGIMVPFTFDPGDDLRDIAQLPLSIRDAFDPNLDLMKVEHLLRSTLGEDLPIDLPIQEEILICTMVMGAVADWWERDQARITEAIGHAERLVAKTGYVLATT